jgi:hypothetical protein
MRKALLAVALWAIPSLAQAQGVPIQDLPLATTPLSSSDLFAVTQGNVFHKLPGTSLGLAAGLGTMSTQNANAVAITGGTISGVTIAGNVTGHASLDLALTGGTMSGNIAMGGNDISGSGLVTIPSTGSVNGVLAGGVGQSATTNWLEVFIGGTISAPNYGLALGATASVSQITGLGSNTTTPSEFGVIGGAQSKTCVTSCNGVDAFATGAFAVNNAQTGGATMQNVWSYFGVVTALPGASNVGSGYTEGIEQDIVNKGLAGQPGAAPKVTPYNPNPLYMTRGMVLASGSGSLDATEQTYEGPASIALEIASNCSCNPTSVGNTPTFKSGIVFQAYALTGGVGADADATITDAISLPRLAGINFWNSGDTTTPAASIYSAMTSVTPHGYNIRFDDAGVAFETNVGFGQGNPILFITPSAAGTCYEQITAGAGDMLFSSAGAANCINYYNVTGSAGGYVFQVNSVNIMDIAATGVSVAGSLTIIGNSVYAVSGATTNGNCVEFGTGNILTDTGAPCSSGGGGGSVTSVGLAVPAASILGLTGSPITTAGTIGLTTTGTSGGVPYFSSTSQLSSSGLLANNAILTGGGAGAAPKSVAITGLVLGNGVSAPSAYAGASACSSGNFVTALSAAGATTCANTGLGTMATQNANAVAITGGTALGLEELTVVSSYSIATPIGGINSQLTNDYPSSSFVLPTAVTGYAIIPASTSGNQAFGVYGLAELRSTGGGTGIASEFTARNFSGNAPDTNLPPNSAIGTTTSVTKGINVTCGFQALPADCSIGIHIGNEVSDPTFSIFNTGEYIQLYRQYGLFIEAMPSGNQISAVIKTNGVGNAMELLSTAEPSLGGAVFEVVNHSAATTFYITYGGDFLATGKAVVEGLPTSAGGGGLFVCVDTSGNFYKKAVCP